MSTFNDYLAIYAKKDIGALTCASKTCSTMPDLVKDIITDYTKSMYVTDQRRQILAQLARMCADLVKAKELLALRRAREDFAYTKIWYERAVQGTEKMLYENKGNAADATIEAAMETREQLEDDRYQDYLYAVNNYNSVIEEKTELLKTPPCAWYHLKVLIEERAQHRLFIAQDWVTQREIDDGLWDPLEYQEDKAEALSQQPDNPNYLMDPDGPAIGCGCWGCAENQPNQQAHMGPGGCFHMPLESEEEDIVDQYADYETEDEPGWFYG